MSESKIYTPLFSKDRDEDIKMAFDHIAEVAAHINVYDLQSLYDGIADISNTAVWTAASHYPDESTADMDCAEIPFDTVGV